MSRRAPRWRPAPEVDAQAINDIAAQLGVADAIARMLVLRGHDSAATARQFLRPRLDQLHASGAMLGLPAAVDRIARAVRADELVMVHGDYDVDGICSATLLTRTLRGVGGRAFPFIPHRLTDGYDLGPAGVKAAVDSGASVVVTCDCGTSAIDAVADLNAAGIDVVISDHHLPRGELPAALALLNPRRLGCEYPDKDLAAVGVAFKLALALAAELRVPDGFIWKMLDLVALATVADVAPLRGENRVFVRYGLRMIAETENLGLRALLRASGMDGKTLTAGRLGFTLGPRLNAAGRLGHALRGVELLMTESQHEANVIARELEELNQRRQSLDRETLDEARAMMQAMPLDDTFGVVLGKQGWHPGVVGIVASRLVEEFGRPVILVALDGDTGKGSGRSISAFDLHAALGSCSDLLLRFGGHRAAAGVTIRADTMERFAERFNQVARERLTHDDLLPELRIDAELELDEAALSMENLLRHFEPFGVGNPAPVFAARNVTIVAPPRVVGRDGLKLRIAGVAGAEVDAIGWGMAELGRRIVPGAPLDIAFRLERDEYQGESRLQARLADIIQR